ncbi:MAG TPA: hypothetical protein VGS18_04880, partial [Thermoplasmata archaeon]|nr:hypothetical protein [Thermoplasmata archaeon]
MRPGLVALGAAFLTVGAVTVLSVYVLPGPTTDRDVSTDIPPSTIGPNETKMALLEGANATSGSFHLDWQSTGAVSVLVYNAPGCTTPEWQCISGDPLDEWSRSISGNFAVS